METANAVKQIVQEAIDNHLPPQQITQAPKPHARRNRFYYAFQWESVAEAIKDTKNIVLIATRNDANDARETLRRLQNDDLFKYDTDIPKNPEADRRAALDYKKVALKNRVVCIGDLYDEETTEVIIYLTNKPKDMTWSEWTKKEDAPYVYWSDELEACGSLPIGTLVLMDHGNRTKNLHRVLTETSLDVISSTEKHVLVPTGKKVNGQDQVMRSPDTKFIYGRPQLPDFNNLTDAENDCYRDDGVNGLEDLIPVYDVDVQTFNARQVLENSVQARYTLVFLNNQPMLWSESLIELFAWRGTGKTLFSLALGLHLASGKSMPGMEIPSQCKVLYVEGELPASQLQERIRQLSHGTAPSNFHILAKSLQRRKRGQAAVTIKTEEGRLAIEAELEKTGSTVLILDSIASLAQINTNNEEQWIPLIEWMVDLRCKGVTVLYLQQAGKAGEQRGHSVSEDRIDLAIKLTATNNNPAGAAFTMSFTKQREGSLTPVRLTCTKGVWAVDEKAITAKRSSKEEEQKQEILEALKTGEPQRDIAARFKVSSATISKIKKEMNDGNTDPSITATSTEPGIGGELSN